MNNTWNLPPGVTTNTLEEAFPDADDEFVIHNRYLVRDEQGLYSQLREAYVVEISPSREFINLRFEGRTQWEPITKYEIVEKLDRFPRIPEAA